MRNNISIAKAGIARLLTATLAVAITLTFSCSSDDDENSSSSSAISNGNGSSSSVTGGGGSSSSATGGGSSSGGGSNLCNGDGTTGINSGSDKGNDIANYRTVQIGEQWWMAENLNYAVEGSKCYGECGQIYFDEYSTLSNAEIQTNCETYGRLYNLATAMALPSKCNSTLSTSDADCAIATPHHQGICPEGWHIPSVAEWGALMQYVNPSCSLTGNCAGAGTKLKAKSGWNAYSGVPSGTDSLGFSALPGGGYTDGGFGNAGSYGGWWSASERYSGFVYGPGMYYDIEDVYQNWNGKSFLRSVRCVQNFLNRSSSSVLLAVSSSSSKPSSSSVFSSSSIDLSSSSIVTSIFTDKGNNIEDYR